MVIRYFRNNPEKAYYAIHENGSLTILEDINCIMVGSYKLTKNFQPFHGWEEITDIEFDLARSKVQHQVNKAILEVLQKGVAA